VTAQPPAAPRARPTARRAILDAAAHVVARQGVAALTLEAVAREAGVSKGGLLYHFGTKEALLQGLLAARLEAYEESLDREVAGDPAGPGRWTRALVRTTFAPAEPAAGIAASLFAAFVADPRLLEPARARYAAWQARLAEDGIDPVRATLARLAADGLYFAELFGLAPPAGTLRERVLEALLALTTEAGAE
jgi:AcrR family transcriptional regulator